jgi:YVTN family beta-propeller protein
MTTAGLADINRNSSNSSRIPPMIKARIKALQVIPAIRVGARSLLFASVIGYVGTSASGQEGTSGALRSNVQPNNTIVATIPVGRFPFALVVSPNNANAYVANFVDNTVSVINTATNAVTATIGVGAVPDSVAVTPDGSTLYVANAKGISVINTSTDTKVATVKVGTSLGVAVSPDGKSLYACSDSGIQVIDTNNHRITATIPLSTPVEAIQVLFNP